MAGRPRKPVEIKKLQGTFRADEAPKNLVAVVEGVPTPPPWLSGRAAEVFNEVWGFLVAANVNSSIDVNALALLASRQEEVERCTMRIEDQGEFIAHKRVSTTTSAKRGTKTITEESFRPNPAIAQRSDAMRHLQALLNEFGLSPAARSKVSANSKSKAKNAFAEF